MRHARTDRRPCRVADRQTRRSEQARRRADAIARVDQGDRIDDVAAQVGISRRTLDRWRADARTSA
nr:helix-turn-helix domain-containing protein [Pseudonocardia sp. EC080625-04]